ncbi:hypothetical protein FBU59_000168 [Linderina macrospora]|uniref:Uncharacterized protein n=1 Tax=Linderina macrospora TaxID=4868 RepID=A0ACC1JHV2_9FUNG|nr:hypothetical protein FBU59_000168 [Linderina macrospora]
MAVGAITKLFPNVTELRSHVSKIWGPTPNINSLDDDAYPLYGYLLRAYAGQLWHVQMLIPFPKNVTKLFEFLTSVSVNIKHVRPREDLPRIPTRCLRIIELFQIDDSIPWRLFETTNSELNFESLEDLLLEFIHEAKQTADFPGCDIPVHMPRLNKLQVTNSSYVYTDIYSYFRNRDLEMLTILDDPINFKKVKEHALAKAKVFRIGHPTGTLFKSAYSVDMVEHLYNLPSNAEEAVLWHIQHPLPKMIAWRNLRSLRMLASIADKHGLANLLAQLPCLKKLIMDCFSMIRADAKDTRFGDQTTTLRGLGRVIKPKDCSPISESLEHLEFKVQGNFDLYGFCELLARLPNANHVKVNESMLFKIMDMLQVEFRVFREILFVPYP